MLMRFEGPRAQPYVHRVLRERRVAGVTLFASNVRDRAQLRTLTRDLQRSGGGRLLVAADQEGGIARRLPWATAIGQPGQTSPRAAAAYAGATADLLRESGVNLNFAPVLDLPTGPAIRSAPSPAAPTRSGRWE